MRFAHTFDEMIDEVRAIAAANPDFVYRDHNEACQYFDHDHRPSCIIGKALYALGYGPQFVIALDGGVAELGQVISLFANRGMGSATDLECNPKFLWLQKVQASQDGLAGALSYPWGECVRIADAFVIEAGYATHSGVTWND